MNGQAGVLEEFIETSGRWRVKLASGDVKDLKPDNLAVEQTGQAQSESQVHRDPQETLGNLILLQIFWIFNIFWSNIKVFGQNNMFFELLRQNPCRIMYKFRQNTIFGSETCEIGSKVGNRTCPDLPRPVLLSKFIIFYKIIRFIK